MRQVRERKSVVLFLLCCVLLSTVPSAGPASVTAGTVTATSIRVQWEEVPCLHRNGKITGYTVETRASGMTIGSEFVNNGNSRSATVSGLNPSTLYTVTVAANNSAGTGPATSIDIETLGNVEIHSPASIVVVYNLSQLWFLLVIIIMYVFIYFSK